MCELNQSLIESLVDLTFSILQIIQIWMLFNFVKNEERNYPLWVVFSPTIIGIIFLILS